MQLVAPNKGNTLGEKRFIQLLERYLDDDYLCWFNLPSPTHIQHFPDIILLHPKMGLLCLEIKDCYQNRLKEASNEKVF